MDCSPSDGLFLVPNGCVGCPCADEVKAYTVLLLFVPVVLWLTLLLLLPRLLLLKALLVKEEAALFPPYYCGILVSCQ